MTTTAAHNLVPQFILDKHAAGEDSGQFDAYVLYMRLDGVLPMLDTLAGHGQPGALALNTAMRAVFDPVLHLVDTYGGFSALVGGFCVTALFLDLDGARAARAAWEICDHMANHPRQTTAFGAFAMDIQIGLAYGQIRWGIPKDQARSRAAYYFIGDAVFAAETAHKLARANEIVVAPASMSILAGVLDGTTDRAHLRVAACHAPVVADSRGALNGAGKNAVPRVGQEAFIPADVLTLGDAGEYRHTVNVFVKLRGEPQPGQVTEFVHAVFALQDKYGGVMALLEPRADGCKVLFHWGAPVSYEDDLGRALNFVLELQSEVDVQFRAAVTAHTGIAGFVGGALQEEYTCSGIAVGLASRLMDRTPWDEILLDEEARAGAASEFDVEYEGHLELLGFDEPQAAYALLGRRRFDAGAIFQGEIVGRSAELARLRDFVDPLLTADVNVRFAGLLIVAGEAGLGKSRLVYDFRRELESSAGDAVQFILCQTEEVSGSALSPFRYWLREYFGHSALQSDARNKRAFSRKLRQIVAATEGELREQLEDGSSFLGALIGLHWDDSRYTQYDPQARYENTLRALRALLLAESRRRPVVVVIEDTHLIDDDSRELLLGQSHFK